MSELDGDSDEAEMVERPGPSLAARPSLSATMGYHKLSINNRKCKIVKRDTFTKMKHEKAKEKKKRRKTAAEMREALGDAAPPKPVPHTTESLRAPDVTAVEEGDEEVAADAQNDEFAGYFDCQTTPKILITTNKKSSLETRKLLDELVNVMPNSEYIKRGKVDMKQLVKESNDKEYTHVVVINEDMKKPNSIVVCHLPEGPTATFRLTSVKLKKQLKRHGNATRHRPEVILNNFKTRLGHSVGRMLGSLFHMDPEFRGRNVVTFHNQRDFIFLRRHRYIFKNSEKVGLQELGPRLTLKLRRFQTGTFDTTGGEYEWYHNHKTMDVSRRTFFL